MFDLTIAGKKALGNFKDPFSKDKITRITMNWSRVLFSKPVEFEWTASIYFKNGDTSGNQDFTNKDFQALLKDMEEFANSL